MRYVQKNHCRIAIRCLRSLCRMGRPDGQTRYSTCRRRRILRDQIGGTFGLVRLTIAYSSFTASGASGIAGAFAGTNSGTISNCVNEKSPVYGYAYGGGITGKNFGSIQNSANKSTVSADYYNGHAGGIAGSNTKNISNY